jgi:hypothetical protein
MPAKQRPTYPVCSAKSCRHCHNEWGAPKPLTVADLAWEFGESEAAMGIHSAHGAMVDMAISGFQSGGRLNTAEDRAVNPRRLNAVGKHRCIHSRLAAVPPGLLAVLRAVYGPDDWTRSLGCPTVRAGLSEIFKALGHQVHRVLPLTTTAHTVAQARLSKPSRPKPSRPTQRPAKAHPTTTNADALRSAAATYLRENEALARGPIGAVLSAAVASNRDEFQRMVDEAHALLSAAHAAVHVATSAPRGVRVSRSRLVDAHA